MAVRTFLLLGFHRIAIISVGVVRSLLALALAFALLATFFRAASSRDFSLDFDLHLCLGPGLRPHVILHLDVGVFVRLDAIGGLVVAGIAVRVSFRQSKRVLVVAVCVREFDELLGQCSRRSLEFDKTRWRRNIGRQGVIRRAVRERFS